MDLTCFLHPGWRPLIRPASARRDWMDGTPESYAYRCLPLNIANAHGWEVLSPFAFEARWNGGPAVGDVEIRAPEDAEPHRAPVSLFGSGVITFHIEGLFRTPPGWNLWVGGSPNLAKDGIAALTGVVETDWSPFTFTMNWRFTRPGHWVRFEAGEPICFFFPVQRGLLDTVEPVVADMGEEPGLAQRFAAWSQARDAFHDQVRETAPDAPADRWQKHYYRGVDISETPGAPDHQSKLRLNPFKGLPDIKPSETALPPRLPESAAAESGADLALRKRDWLLRSLEAQRRLAPDGLVIERRGGLSRDEFLNRYYAPARPVILTGEMSAWPALYLWNPAYLRELVGGRMIEFQGGRSSDPLFEMYKDGHRRQAPFDAFIDAISAQAGNDAYITAYNSSQNLEALSVLDKDVALIDKLLSPDTPNPHAMKWIGPAETTTHLHHDLTNNLIAQAVGSKRVRLVAAADVGRMYNSTHVFSDIRSFEDPGVTIEAFPAVDGLTVYEVVLGPGEALFVPLGWWHEVKSLSFSVSLTYTNFLWPNDAYQDYPAM